MYNLKNVKNTHGGALLLENFTKSNTPPGLLCMFFKLYKWYQIVQKISHITHHRSHIQLKRKDLDFENVGSLVVWDLSLF